MCGIAGCCGPVHRFDDDKLRDMLGAIEHRGPDDSGMYCARARTQPGIGIWLGSRRLAIQDLSPAGHQPMIEPSSGNVIAFNGEIYNFLDLRQDLEKAGVSFQSRGDTEVALHSWSKKGLAAADDWRGMFGVALWDPAGEELWLLRDPMGIKPLYYRWDGEQLTFCSEIRGLIAAGVAPLRLSRRGLEDYLRYGALQDPVTIIDGVYALLPGHALRWSRGTIEIRRYSQWPDPDVDSRNGFESSSIEPMLRTILRQQLISDVPVAVFLSGGVDSSVVSLMAREEEGPGVHTMSVVFEEDRFSEQHYARRVAAHIGTQHHEVLLTGAEAQHKAVEAISRMDQPSTDGINTYVVCEAVRRAGFTVALSGLGGDEFFGGYATFRRTGYLKRAQQWMRLIPAVSRGMSKLAAPWLAGSGDAGRKLRQYLDNGDFDQHPYFLQRTIFFPRQVNALLRGGIPSSEADQMAEARLQSLLEQARGMDLLNQVSLLEVRTYMTNMLLRDSDQMSMAHSLELRVPLVDHILGKHLLAVPGARKGFGHASKLWLRQAFAARLPDEVFTRKKMGFTLPFAVWLKGPLRQEVERTLRLDLGGVLESSAALEVWRDFLQGRIAWSRPWTLYVLSRWVGEHITRTGRPSASSSLSSSSN